MNIKEYQKILNYQLLSNYCIDNRLLDNYYKNKDYLKTWAVDISAHYIEHNSIMCISSINSNYHILIINDRVKLFNNDIKLYDATIKTPLKKYKIIMVLINKYLKNKVVLDNE